MALKELKISNFAALSDILFGGIGHVLAFSDFSGNLKHLRHHTFSVDFVLAYYNYGPVITR